MGDIEKYVNGIMKLADFSKDNNYHNYVNKKLIELVKYSDENIKECFFSGTCTTNLSSATMTLCSELAVRYVTYVIGNSGNRKFASRITTVSYEDIGTWFKFYASQVGEDILKSYIEEQFELPKDKSVRRTYFNKVADMLCNDYFAAVTKLISVTRSPRPAQILIAALKACDFLAYTKVRNAWADSNFFKETFADYNILLMLDEYPYLEEYKYADILSKNISKEIHDAMTKKCSDTYRWLEAPYGPALYGLLSYDEDVCLGNIRTAPYINMQMIYRDEMQCCNNNINQLSLYHEKLYVNNAPVPYYHEGNRYVWKNEEDWGCVWFYHHGLAAEGYVEKGGQKQKFSASSEDVSYGIKYTVGGTDKELVIKMGTRINPDTKGYLLYGALYFEGNKVIENYSSCDGIHIDKGAWDNGFFKTEYKDGSLNIHINVANVLWSVLGESMIHDMFGKNFDIWRAELTLSKDFTSMEGKVWEQITIDSISKEGSCYKVKGSHMVPELTANLETHNSLVVNDVQKRALKAKLESVSDSPKSITELYTLPAPNMKEANVLASQTLYNLMVYYVADKIFDCKGTKIEWHRWFGKNKDMAKEMVVNVDSRILNLVEGEDANEEVQKFLVNYAKGSLANAYAGSSDSDIETALESAKERLKKACTLPELCSYYLQGDGNTSLAKDKGYNIAIEIINKYAYAKLTPGLLKYIEDADGNWGEQLYKQCLATLPQLQIEAISGGSSELSHKTMMLNILDDKKYDNLVVGVNGTSVPMTYGVALYTKVFNLQLSQIADALGISFTGDPNTPDFRKMMREIFNIMWEELQKDTSDYFSAEILKAFREEREKFKELQQEEYIQECIDMTIAGMEMIQAGATISSVIPKLKELSKKPSATYTGLSCSILFYAVSLGSLATVFMKWDKATAAEKVEAILVCIQGVCQIAMSIRKILDMRILLNPNSTPGEKINAALRLRLDAEDMSTIRGMASVDGTEIDTCSSSCAQEFALELEEENFEAVASKFTKFFRIAEYVLRGLTVVLMGLVTVMSAVELAKKVKEGGWSTEIYLEVISTSLMGLCCVLEGVTLVVDLVGGTCACIPVIGAVCCLVGLVFQIIAMAISEPINPMVRFITDEINPFLNGLDIPSPEWIKEHNKSDNLAVAFA